MTAIERLRQLACDINEEEIRSHSVITLNQGRYNRQFRLDVNHDWLNAWHAEFERILQAIAATLGDADLAAENAKLRALVKQTYAFFAWADGATFSDGTPAVHASDRREVEDRMRELGVEVDQ